MHQRMSANIRQSIKKNKAGRTWESIVGYTLLELMEHLELKFVDGMSWDNTSEWNVDHIVPKFAFNYESDSEEGFKYCWALDNLRPLWKMDNAKKRENITEDVVKYLETHDIPCGILTEKFICMLDDFKNKKVNNDTVYPDKYICQYNSQDSTGQDV